MRHVIMLVNYVCSKFKIHRSKRLLVNTIKLEAKKFVVYRNITKKDDSLKFVPVHFMKAYRKGGVRLQAFLSLAIDEGELSAS